MNAKMFMLTELLRKSQYTLQRVLSSKLLT